MSDREGALSPQMKSAYLMANALGADADLVADFQRIVEQFCDFAEERELHPRQSAVLLCGLLGTFALVEARNDVRADAVIQGYLDFAEAALNVGIARVRLANGWRP